MSKVLILLGSPRKHGNTAKLAAEFARGAKESGHTVTEIILKEKPSATAWAAATASAAADSACRRMTCRKFTRR